MLFTFLSSKYLSLHDSVMNEIKINLLQIYYILDVVPFLLRSNGVL